jgi:hypothetical protein
MEGTFEWVTVPVSSYQIMDSDEKWHHPDNPLDFDQANALLEKLKSENPGKDYTLFAELF